LPSDVRRSLEIVGLFDFGISRNVFNFTPQRIAIPEFAFPYYEHLPAQYMKLLQCFHIAPRYFAENFASQNGRFVAGVVVP